MYLSVRLASLLARSTMLPVLMHTSGVASLYRNAGCSFLPTKWVVLPRVFACTLHHLSIHKGWCAGFANGLSGG